MPIIRKKIIIQGIVQGVGFRPNVYKLALKNNISGLVKNNAEGVVIEAEGERKNIKKFIDDLKRKKPPQSIINSINIFNSRIKNEKSFLILKSGKESNITRAIIPADLGICDDCRGEILKSSNRRYLYPFTNCTNCGPRFTIVKKIPYDRPLTTMKKFKMCSKCVQEYTDPLDRRFHAQPNACAVCGPKIKTEYKGKYVEGQKALALAIDLIKKGKIAAIESLGGFHLACDANNKKVIERLRKSKNRLYKPFALMLRNLKEAERICHVNAKEKEILKSAAAPIVMLKKKKRDSYEGIAPGLNTLGIMLPYTPLHEVLFRILREKGFQSPLVMTSGNKRDEPIAKSFKEAKEKLSQIVDIIIYHDRDIHNRVDDSVGFVSKGEFYLLRRSRGFVPSFIKLSRSSSKAVFASGAELKNTFCLVRGDNAFVSQHIGDLSEVENQKFYTETIEKFKKLLTVKPSLIAYDSHPNSSPSNYALALKGKNKKSIQHHLAHILSVAAEHQIKKPFMGVALDGTGYGLDSHIWGCEFISVTPPPAYCPLDNQKRQKPRVAGQAGGGVKASKAERLAHLTYFKLPGGDAATTEIWRGALSLIKRNSLDKKFQKKASDFFKNINKTDLNSVAKMMDANINSPLTSSMGRLFDAVAFLAGIRDLSDYEAQAAMELESLCEKKPKSFYKFLLVNEAGKIIIDPMPVIAEIIKSGAKKNRAKIISEKFHLGVAMMITDVFERLRHKNGISDIALSGGVFQNRIILEWTMALLKKKNFRVFTNINLPANDACVSLGQAYGALNKIEFKS